jgi:hypothetical protein
VSKDPEEFRVRHFGISACKGIVAIEIVISRYPKERQGSGDVEERDHTFIGVRDLEESVNLCSKNRDLEKCDFPNHHRSGP